MFVMKNGLALDLLEWIPFKNISAFEKERGWNIQSLVADFVEAFELEKDVFEK